MVAAATKLTESLEVKALSLGLSCPLVLCHFPGAARPVAPQPCMWQAHSESTGPWEQWSQLLFHFTVGRAECTGEGAAEGLASEAGPHPMTASLLGSLALEWKVPHFSAAGFLQIPHCACLNE